MGNGLQNGKQFFHGRNLLVVKQDIRILEFANHFFAIGNEIRGNVAAVELHTAYGFHLSFGAFGFFNGDDTFDAYFFHGFGNQVTDGFVTVGRDTADLAYFFEVVTHFFFLAFQVFHYGSHGFVDTSFQFHRIGTGSNVFQANINNGLCQDSGCGRTVSGIISGFGSHFFDHLCTDVGIRIGQFNFFGYAYTVFGDVWSSEFLLNDYIAAFRSEGYFYCICQLVYPFFHQVAGFDIEFYFFCHDIVV